MERRTSLGRSRSAGSLDLQPRRQWDWDPAAELTKPVSRGPASGAVFLEPEQPLLPLVEPWVSRLQLRVSHTAESGALRIDEAEKEMKSHKVAWMKGKVLYGEIQEILRDLKICIGNNMATSADKCFCQTLEQRLLVTETIGLLGADGENEPSLLGLHHDDLRRLLPSDQAQKEMKEWLVRELEEKLNNKCLSLFYYFSPKKGQGVAESEALRLAKACRLHELVRVEQEGARADAARLHELQTARDIHISTHLKTLQTSMAMLEKMLREHRLSWQAKSDAVKMAYLQAKHRTMCLKLQLEELKILCDTYTPDKVQAHKILKKELKAAMATEQKEEARVSGELAAYGTLGPDFEQLVQEYTRLHGAIDNKKWALREFRKNAA